MDIKTIVLAAGKGTRMKSALPKVLHCIAGKPMLQWVVESVSSFKGETVVVCGHGAELVKDQLAQPSLKWVEQTEQLGTGHAVQQTIQLIDDADKVLILYGDVPLIETETLRTLLQQVNKNTMGLLTVNLDDPTGYGRILRENKKVQRIVEHKDANETERAVNEVNTGILAVTGSSLKKWLSQLENDNAQEEYYLTDIIEMAVNDGVDVKTVQPKSEFEVKGVNARKELNELERYYQRKNAESLMEQGVTLADANRIDVRGKLVLTGSDIFIDSNVIFEGTVILGEGVNIGSNCVIRDAQIANNVTIKSHCVLEDCEVSDDSVIGPFARLRPGAELDENVRIGNFVEVKKSKVGQGSKINHLSYIGDADIGKNVNIGAGTITCNYDGVNKF